MAERPFPFLALLRELQQEVVELTDLPTRLALGLTCSEMREHFWGARGRNFFNWFFLDDCARLGYFGLLRYAYDNGSFVDVGQLLISIELR